MSDIKQQPERRHLDSMAASVNQGAIQSNVLKNALKMTFGTMTSRSLGLLRESLMAALFDKSITDAWGAAFRIPNMFRRLLGEGSLSVSFIPVFVEAKHDSTVRAQNLVNTLYTFLLILLSALTVWGIVFPDHFLQLVLDPQYTQQIEKYEMTRNMMQIMFGFVFFISSFAFYMGILNALGQFFWPAIAPTFWNLAMVISTIIPITWLTDLKIQHGEQLAWGVLVGGALQAAVLIPALIRSGYFPKINFHILNKDLLQVFKNMGPGLIGMGLLQFTTIVNLRFSSSLIEGTISYINYVDRLIELPLSLISVSLGTALLPVLSKHWVEGAKEKMAATSKHFLELNLFISISAAVGLFALADPIVRILFGRGRFLETDIFQTVIILKTYCWIMLFSSGVRVLTPAYYAVKNTWFPAAVSAFCLACHMFIAPILMAKYQVQGLMISTIISAFLNLFLLLLFYQKLIYRFPYLSFLVSLSKYSFVGAVIYLTTFVYDFIVPTVFGYIFNPDLTLLICLMITLFIVMVVFGVFSFWLFPDESSKIKNKILRKSN